MKVNIEFNLDQSNEEYFEENAALLRLIKSKDLLIAISNFDDKLRSIIKYNDKLSDEQIEMAEDIRQKLHDELLEYGINIEELLQ